MRQKKVVFISGSTRGIGLEIAKKFSRENFSVILNSKAKVSKDKLKILKKEIKEFYYYNCDLSDQKKVNSLFKNLKRKFKKIDVIINNAGMSSGSKVGMENYNEWLLMFKNNFLTTTNTVEAFTKIFRNSLEKSKIICISSTAAHYYNDAPSAYIVSKKALNTYVKLMGQYLAKFKMNINAISPGNILTKGGTWDKKMKKNKRSVINYINNVVPLKKFGNPSDIVELAFFLGSEKANFINGSIVVSDGGQEKTL
mgnify:CR=1 FL=1